MLYMCISCLSTLLGEQLREVNNNNDNKLPGQLPAVPTVSDYRADFNTPGGLYIDTACS